MKKIMMLVVCLATSLFVFGQGNDSISQAQTKTHTDSQFGYKVVIPDWLKVKDTGSPNLWGGTMEPLNGIENAVLIVGFSKKDYKNIKKLIEDKVEQYKTGDMINSNQTFMLRQDLGIIENKGHGYKVQMLTGNTPYYNMYVFAETSQGYLWIIFTATPDTYDVNISKFYQFLKGLELK
jgi:hypothetical protein